MRTLLPFTAFALTLQPVSSAAAQIYPLHPRAPACDSTYIGSRKAKTCLDSLARSPTSNVHAVLADEYVRAENWQGALREYAAAAAIDSTLRRPNRDSVLAFVARNDLARASALVRQPSFETSPGMNSTTARFLAARVRFAADGDTAGLWAFRQSAREQRPDPRFDLFLGDAYAQSGQSTLAMNLYRSALGSAGTDSVFAAHAWASMAKLMSRTGLPANASFYWEKAAQLDSSYFRANSADKVTYEKNLRAAGIDEQRRAPTQAAAKTAAKTASRADTGKAAAKKPQ